SDLHGAAVVDACVLDAFLVLLVLHSGRIGRAPTHVCSCVLVAALAGAGLASDELLYLAGFVPFVVAGLAQLWWQPSVAGRRIALSTLPIATLVIAGSRNAVAAVHAHHTHAANYGVSYAARSELAQPAL